MELNLYVHAWMVAPPSECPLVTLWPEASGQTNVDSAISGIFDVWEKLTKSVKAHFNSYSTNLYLKKY